MRSRLFWALAAGAVAALLVAGLGTGASAGPSVGPGVAHKGGAHALITPSAHKSLYDQNDMDQGIGIVSENFGEPIFEIYDSQGADDFTVPSGRQWTVKEVDVTGVYFNGAGPAASENVSFYQSSSGRPGALIHKYSRIVGVDNGTGSFVIDLGRGVKLGEGHYWVSVQINMRFDCCGEWGWETRTTQHRKPAMWQNPGDGFSTGCTTYRALTKCIPVGEGPDFMFALRGKKQ
jgi:hypothetical protein